MSGQVAATVEQYPDTAELTRRGFHVLVDVTDLAANIPTPAMCQQDVSEEQSRGVKRFLAPCDCVSSTRTTRRLRSRSRRNSRCEG